MWERHLIDTFNDSVHPFLEHFTRDDGEFIWEDEWGGGSCDDYYEPFFSWPQRYVNEPAYANLPFKNKSLSV